MNLIENGGHRRNRRGKEMEGNDVTAVFMYEILKNTLKINLSDDPLLAYAQRLNPPLQTLSQPCSLLLYLQQQGNENLNVLQMMSGY